VSGAGDRHADDSIGSLGGQLYYHGSTFSGRIEVMGVEKMSVSFDLELGEAIRTSATGGNQSVSAWLAEAARDRLRLEALGEAIAAWEEQFGALSDDEVAEADRLLHPPTTSRTKAATSKRPGTARKKTPRRRGAA
jgi:hypothetical protein